MRGLFYSILKVNYFKEFWHNMKGIKHIIFDLGGVILNIDYKLTENAFIKSGITNFAELYSQASQTTLFSDLETGAISADIFIEKLMQSASINLSEEQIAEAWNAMLLDIPVRRLQILQQLRLHYDLFLLSNTNEIHERAFNKILMTAHGIPNIGVFFDKVYFSHRVGLRKPGEEIFKRILEENNLLPSETLFIDDSEQHIETAKRLGLQTIFLRKGMTIENDVFKESPSL